MRQRAVELLQQAKLPEQRPSGQADDLARVVSDLQDHAGDLRQQIAEKQSHGDLAVEDQQRLTGVVDLLHEASRQLQDRIPPVMQARIAKAVSPDLPFDRLTALMSNPATHFATAEIGNALRDQVIPPGRQADLQRFALTNHYDPEIVMQIAEMAAGGKAINDLNSALRGEGNMDPATVKALTQMGLLHHNYPSRRSRIQRRKLCLRVVGKKPVVAVWVKAVVMDLAGMVKEMPATAISL